MSLIGCDKILGIENFLGMEVIKMDFCSLVYYNHVVKFKTRPWVFFKRQNKCGQLNGFLLSRYLCLMSLGLIERYWVIRVQSFKEIVV